MTPTERRLPLVELAVFVVVFGVYFGWGNVEASWDVLERSYVLAHWSEAPTTHRYFRTHVLELPLARPFAALLAGPTDPTAGLRGLGSACAALLAALTYRWGRAGERGWAFGLACVALQVSAFGVWKLGSGGEEKMVASAAAILVVAGFAVMRARAPSERETVLVAVVAGIGFGLAVLVHVANAALGLGLAAATLLTLLPGVTLAEEDADPKASLRARRLAQRQLVFAGLTAAVVLVTAHAILATLWFPGHPEPGVAVFEAVFRYHQAPSPSPSGAVGIDALLEGWGATVSPGLVGVLGFGVVLTAAVVTAASVAWTTPTQRTTVAVGGGAALAWFVHFLGFEPWNAESWLVLWLAATCTLAAALPRRWVVAATIVAALAAPGFVFSSWPGYVQQRQGRGQAWAQRMASLCTDDAIVILDEGLYTRAMRLYAPSVSTIGVQELFGEREAYVGGTPVTTVELARHMADGKVVCLPESTARRLAARVRVDAKSVGTLAGERVLHLKSPLGS